MCANPENNGFLSNPDFAFKIISGRQKKIYFEPAIKFKYISIFLFLGLTRIRFFLSHIVCSLAKTKQGFNILKNYGETVWEIGSKASIISHFLLTSEVYCLEVPQRRAFLDPTRPASACPSGWGWSSSCWPSSCCSRRSSSGGWPWWPPAWRRWPAQTPAPGTRTRTWTWWMRKTQTTESQTIFGLCRCRWFCWAIVFENIRRTYFSSKTFWH